MDEALERIARSGEAMFAIDGAERIVLWNGPCERLVGKTARDVLGKPCAEVMRGRDGNGNLYCHRSCAVVHQARDTDEPVRDFELDLPTGDGKRTRVSVTMFPIRSYHPALASVLHVLRPVGPAEAVPGRSGPPAAETGDVEAVLLTRREREILECLAEGMETEAIASRLFIERVTVRNHVQNVLQKLDVHSKLEAVAASRQRRLI